MHSILKSGYSYLTLLFYFKGWPSSGGWSNNAWPSSGGWSSGGSGWQSGGSGSYFNHELENIFKFHTIYDSDE